MFQSIIIIQMIINKMLNDFRSIYLYIEIRESKSSSIELFLYIFNQESNIIFINSKIFIKI